MKILRIFQTTEFINKKNNKKFYIQIVELSNGDDSFMIKLLSSIPLDVGNDVKLPYLLTDYQKYAIKVL